MWKLFYTLIIVFSYLFKNAYWFTKPCMIRSDICKCKQSCHQGWHITYQMGLWISSLEIHMWFFSESEWTKLDGKWHKQFEIRTIGRSNFFFSCSQEFFVLFHLGNPLETFSRCRTLIHEVSQMKLERPHWNYFMLW